MGKLEEIWMVKLNKNMKMGMVIRKGAVIWGN
jgi:hypothetical protein